jgi:predicted nucleic acid-binding protein
MIEPRARDLTVPVVDASVVVDWVAPGVAPDAPALAALARLASTEAELLAPRLLLEEVSNALLTGVRRGRWDGAQADAGHTLLLELPVRLIDEPRDLRRRGTSRAAMTTTRSTTCSTSRWPSADAPG